MELWTNGKIFLEEDFHAVEFEDAGLTALADLIAVEEFEFAHAFIVFVLDADASVPFLYFARLRPELDIDWFGAVEDEAGGGDVNALHWE